MSLHVLHIVVLLLGIFASSQWICAPARAQQFQINDADQLIPMVAPHLMANPTVQESAVETAGLSNSLPRTSQADQSEWEEIGDLGIVEQTRSFESIEPISNDASDSSDWFKDTRVGYDDGFLIANENPLDLQAESFPFRMRLNGWGQLRQTYFQSRGSSADANQFQLKRGRLIFSGSAFTSDFSYFFQLDGRSSSGDDMRLLDYRLDYDIGHHRWGLESGTLGFRTGKYKMPFTLARWLSGREFEFSDRSVASTYFDVNRSLGWGLYGSFDRWRVPIHWESAIFNGLVTGGAETGSSGRWITISLIRHG